MLRSLLPAHLRVHFDKEAADGNGFEAKILDGIDAIQETQKKTKETLLQEIGRLDKDTKKNFEDITTLKKTANDSDADAKKLLKKFGELEIRLRNETRAAFGDPVRRIQADEEMRPRFTIAVRLAMNKDGDMSRICEPLQKALGEDSSPGSTLLIGSL